MKLRDVPIGHILAATMVVTAWTATAIIWTHRPENDMALRIAGMVQSTATPAPNAVGTPSPASATPSPTPSGAELVANAGGTAEREDGERVPMFLRSSSDAAKAARDREVQVESGSLDGPFGRGPAGAETVDAQEAEAVEAMARRHVARLLDGSGTDEGLSVEGRGQPHRLPEDRAAEAPGEASPARGGSRSSPAVDLTRRNAQEPIRPGERILDLPQETRDEPPPPPGRAYIRTGSIPVEQSLQVSGESISSFTLNRRFFTPGTYQIRLKSIKGCIEFPLTVRADEIVYAIYDFELGGWRRAERVGADGRSRLSVALRPCQEAK